VPLKDQVGSWAKTSFVRESFESMSVYQKNFLTFLNNGYRCRTAQFLSFRRRRNSCNSCSASFLFWKCTLHNQHTNFLHCNVVENIWQKQFVAKHRKSSSNLQFLDFLNVICIVYILNSRANMHKLHEDKFRGAPMGGVWGQKPFPLLSICQLITFTSVQINNSIKSWRKTNMSLL